MTEAYDYFMVYELDDTGERKRVNISENQFRENNGMNVLHPAQVVVIVKEELRRIFIWKGSKSPVRKRFISSRVASALQEELVNRAAFHRCKIVSVDQGDEVQEFLNTFRFESMPVEERLADMRYIRNIDKDKMYDKGIIPEGGPKVVKVEKKKRTFVSPALKELQKTRGKKPTPLYSKTMSEPKGKAPIYKQPYQLPPVRSPVVSRQTSILSEENEKKIKERILKNEVPENYRRQHLVLGHNLYGVISKKVTVFGKSIEETEWDKVTNLPKDTIEIDDHKLRIYFDQEKSIVEAIEILQKEEKIITPPPKKPVSKKSAPKRPALKKPIPKETAIKKTIKAINYNSWTVKELKNYCAKHEIELPYNARKVDIIKIIKETIKDVKEEKVSITSRRRELPKIPSKND
jgi:hypothetical protein